MDIKEISNIEDEFNSTYLELLISGKNIGYPIINALRKACINQIPTYAFHPSKINILHNKSVFDNSYMKGRLSQLPITKINHDLKFLPLKYYKDVNFADIKLDKHPDDNMLIEYYVKVRNDGPDRVLNVSTNNLQISINNLKIEPSEKYSKKNPILLIQLRPGDEFECSMKGVLAIGEIDAIFDSSNSYYEEIAENKYSFKIESNGQLPEYEIILRACEIIIEKNKIIKENINNNQYQMLITENNSMILEILNEDYTCGGPINFILQNMDKIIFSGITKPDFMQKNILIKFKAASEYKPIDVLNDAIDQSVKIFEEIKHKINSLYKGEKINVNKKSKK